MKCAGTHCIFRIVVLCTSAFALSTLGISAQENKAGRETYSAMLAATQGALAGKTTNVTIHIEGYSDDQQAKQLASTLKTKGQAGLLEAVGSMKEQGRILPAGGVGTAFQVVREHPAEGGRKIVMLANRPMAFVELQNATRSRNYPFGLVVLNVDSKGEGQGLLYGACQIRFNDKNEVEVEQYGQAPARLMNVRLMK